MGIAPDERVALERRLNEIEREIEALQNQPVPLVEKWQKAVALQAEQKEIAFRLSTKQDPHR